MPGNEWPAGYQVHLTRVSPEMLVVYSVLSALSTAQHVPVLPPSPPPLPTDLQGHGLLLGGRETLRTAEREVLRPGLQPGLPHGLLLPLRSVASSQVNPSVITLQIVSLLFFYNNTVSAVHRH